VSSTALPCPSATSRVVAWPQTSGESARRQCCLASRCRRGWNVPRSQPRNCRRFGRRGQRIGIEQRVRPPFAPRVDGLAGNGFRRRACPTVVPSGRVLPGSGGHAWSLGHPGRCCGRRLPARARLHGPLCNSARCVANEQRPRDLTPPRFLGETSGIRPAVSAFSPTSPTRATYAAIGAIHGPDRYGDPKPLEVASCVTTASTIWRRLF
jgi:hypothetical protein